MTIAVTSGPDFTVFVIAGPAAGVMVYRVLKLTFRLTCCVFVFRLKRDIVERSRDLEGVLKQYNKFVKPVSQHCGFIVCLGSLLESNQIFGVIKAFVMIKTFIDSLSKT